MLKKLNEYRKQVAEFFRYVYGLDWILLAIAAADPEEPDTRWTIQPPVSPV